MGAGFWVITSEPEPWCLTYAIRLNLWGPFVCLLAGFVGAIVLARLGASIAAYLLIGVVPAILAALAYAAGMLGYACMPVDGPAQVFAIAGLVFVIALVAAGVGAVPGYLLGRLVTWFRGRAGQT